MLPKEEASLFSLEINGEILPRRQLAFKYAFIVEAFGPFAISKPRHDNMFAGGYSKSLSVNSILTMNDGEGMVRRDHARSQEAGAIVGSDG